MQYVIGYSVSALLFLCVLTVRFLNSRQINSYKNLFFAILLISGCLWISWNIVFRCVMSYFSVIPEECLVLMEQVSYLFFIFILIIILHLRKKWKIDTAGERILLLVSAVSAAAVGFQQCYPEISFSDMAIAVSVSALYFAFCDADKAVDTENGCFNGYGLKQFLEDGTGRKTIRYGMAVAAKAHFSKQVIRELMDAAENNPVYHLEGEVFLILCRRKEHYRKLQRNLYGRLEHSRAADSKEEKYAAWICGIEELEIEKVGKEFPDLLKYAVKKERCLINQELWQEFRRFKDVERYLRKATEENHFSMEYQPIWSVEQERFVMLEALVRLKHPIYGDISPADFIPMAEEMGIIPKITACVLEQVTDFMQEEGFRALGMKNVKVNLSAMDLVREELEEQIRGLLQKKGISPGQISLELTETAATSFGEVIRKNFQRLRRAGMTLTLDDFGSGYANLESVMQLEFDMVKIDRSMLLSVEKKSKNRALYRNVVEMLKKSGFPVVAEGAETEEQVRLLEAWKVDYIQGFYFSRPLTREKILEKLKQ